MGSEAGRTGMAPPSFSGSAPYTRRRRDGRPARTTRRCTIKQLHLELQRVFGEERVSMRELKVALSACLSGRSRRAGWTGDGGEKDGTKKALALDWVSVDQLDAALTNCHIASRALDPQGACHPPLTGKRAAEFLASTNRLQASSAARAALQRAMTSVAERQIDENGTRWGRGGGGRIKRRKRNKATAVVAARRRAVMWTGDERDLAERELAAAIVEQQQASVEGYVQQRRRYLSRRVTAQREGHGGFTRERVEVDIRPGGTVTRCKPTEAPGGDFADALRRTKIRLKVLEAKASTHATTAVTPPPTQHKDRGATPLRGAIARRRNPRQGEADDLRVRKEPTLAALIRSSPTHGGTRVSTTLRASAPKADVSRLLRTLTETYSDRIQERGGGIMSCRSPNSKGPRSSAWDGVQGEATMYAERSRVNAAAFTLQQAFRRRMFHRFIWAQAYLRRPTHAFRIFKRVCEPLPAQPGYGHLGDLKQSLPTVTSSHGHLDDEHAAELIVSIDKWPEPPGFHVSSPRHEHAADAAFRNYQRWRRKRSEKNDTGRDASGGSFHGAEVPPTAGYRSPQLSASPEPPRGAELFERKYPIRREVLRTLFLDLRITVAPVAMEVAIRDLDTALLGEYPSMAEGGRKSGSIGHPMSRDRGPSRPKETSPPRHGHARKLDFATFYTWWVRHLPYDPTSAGSILKTVRCARALHVSEMAERAAIAARA